MRLHMIEAIEILENESIMEICPLLTCSGALRGVNKETFYHDPTTQGQAIGAGLVVQHEEQVGTWKGLELWRCKVWLANKNVIAKVTVLRVPDGTISDMYESSRWVSMRCEKWQKARTRHSMSLTQDPRHFQALASMEIDYLKKLQKSIEIAIEKREKFL